MTIKHLVFCLLVGGLLVAKPAIAKPKPQADTSLAAGLQLGLNVNNYDTTPDIKPSSAFGLIFGGQLELGVTELFFLQSEFRLNQKGFKYNQVTGANEIKVTTTINYLEFPMLVKLKFPPVNPVRVFLVAGPNLGFKLSDSFEITVNGNKIDNGFLPLEFKSFDIAFDFGGGAEFDIASNVALFGMLRYSYGLINVSDSASSNIDWKSRGVQITGGISFYL